MRLALLALVTFVLFLSTLVGTPVIPDLAAELGAGAGATAAILSASLMTVVLVQVFSGGLVDRFDRRWALGGAALAGGLTSLGCALGANPRQISLMLAVEAACFTLASWGVGRASDRWGRRPFLIAAQPLVILACLGLVWAQSLPWLVAAYALYGLAGGTTFLLGLVMAADVTPEADAAGLLGAFDAAVDLLLFVSPALALAAYGALDRVEPLLLAAALPALLALPVALRVRETRRVG